MFTESKKWVLSKTIWASIFTAVSAILGLFGIIISPDISALLAGHVVEIMAIIGSLIAIWGRFKASQRIRR